MSQQHPSGNASSASSSRASAFAILGVPATATHAEIRAAYLEKARSTHPDRNGGSKESFDRVKTAYDLLTAPPTPSPPNIPHFVFDGARLRPATTTAAAPGAARQAPKPSRGEVSLTLEQVFEGGRFAVQRIEPRQRACAPCRTTGASNPANRHICNLCYGRGMDMQRVVCRKCSGRCYEPIALADQCTTCKGRGKFIEIDDAEPPSVSFAPGMAIDQSSVTLHGQGDESFDHTTQRTIASDLIVTVEIKSHAIFERVGAHLIRRLSISIWEALLGFVRVMIDIDVDEPPIVVREDTSVIDKELVRIIRGHGMMCENGDRGHLFVVYVVDTQKSIRELTEQQRLDLLRIVEPASSLLHIPAEVANIPTSTTPSSGHELQEAVQAERVRERRSRPVHHPHASHPMFVDSGGRPPVQCQQM